MPLGMPVASGLKPYEQALLNAIASKESGGRYNVRYTPQGGATFEGYDSHPGIYERGPAGPSSAAGRYQFVKSTWDSLPAEAKGDGKFTPENQDRAALWLARRDYASRGGGNLDDVLQQQGLTPSVLKTLAPTWAAFGGRPDGIIQAYNDTLGGKVPSTTDGAGSGAGATSGSDSVSGDVTKPSLTSSFLTGGPGALFGAPQEGWNLGDALMGAGASLMARDNPQGAAALMASVTKNRDQTRKNALEMIGTTPNKKQIILRDPKTGNITYQDIPESGTKTDPEQADDKTRETFGKNNQTYTAASQIAEDTHTIRQAILDGKLKFDAWSNVQDALKNYTGNADEGSRLRAAVTRLQQQMILAEQLKQKGVQTEGDAQRMLQAYWPTSVNYDSSLALQNLDKLHDASRKDLASYGSMNKKTIERYKEMDSGIGIDGQPVSYSKNYDSDLKRWNDVNTEYGPRRDQFLSNKDNGGAGGVSVDAYTKWKKNRK